MIVRKIKLNLIKKWVLGSALLGICAMPSFALADHVELQYEHSTLSQGYGVWNDVNIYTVLDHQPTNQWTIETDYKDHFNETAFLGAINLTHTYNEYWYQDTSLASSTDSNILPGLDFFNEIHRKTLSDLSLVPGIGMGYTANHAPYSGYYGIAELVYYFWQATIQTGVRLNRSLPGPVDTKRVYAVITFFKGQNFEASYRYDTGEEGYTVISDNSFTKQIASTVQTVQLRYRFNPTMGITLKYEYYWSDAYTRNDLGAGITYAF